MAAISSVGTQFTGANAGDIKGTITAISLGGISTAEIDVTSISSSTKEYVMGTMDGGTVDVTVNLDAGVVCSMPTAGDTSPTAFVLRFGASSLGVAFTFSAYIQSVSVEAGVDAQVTASYTLRISGAITVAVAA